MKRLGEVPEVDMRVLGPIEVHEGHLLAIGGPRQRRIMAALAMHAGEVVSIDRLVEVVWFGEQPPDKAQPNLRTYVYRVRAALGPDASDRLVTTTSGYSLHTDPDDLDAWRFEDLIETARRMAAQGDAVSAVSTAEEALRLWRGQPYDEFATEDWALPEVERLSELRARAIELRAESLITIERADDAVLALEGLIGEYPLREHPRRLLMLGLYRSGRQAEAIRVFQDFRALLVSELGIEPSTDLAELELRILNQDRTLSNGHGRSRSIGSYELDRVIGEGAFAMVWHGRQPLLGREVAVKQIRARLANDPAFIRRFEIEAQLVSKLEHPHIVPLYDFWREPDAAYLVMRLLRGGTLEDRLTERPLDEVQLRRLVDQIGSALRLAHDAGVVHRDVRPANVLLDDEGNFYLADFGIAVGHDGGDDPSAAALSSGSPPFASPEQLRGDIVDARADIHGLGMTLYAAAVGTLPFAGENSRSTLVRRRLEEPLPTPSAVAPGVPDWLDTVVANATAIRLDERYADIDALLADAPPPAAATARTDRMRQPTKASDPSRSRNPFKGLQAFTEADADDFKGRTRLVARFLHVLRRAGSDGRLLAVVGPSGSGKSSAVRAGLIPALRSGAVEGSERWFITTMVPGAHPFEELESALTRIAPAPPGPLAELMARSDRALGSSVQRILPDEASELFLVIDQFEELFTQVDSDAERDRFLGGLLAAIRDPRARLRVVVTIRADFWDRPLRHPGLAPLLESAAVTVSPLDPDELELAIAAPVTVQGVTYEAGLVARVAAEVHDHPGALPLLQFTLTELFDRRDANTILTSSYDDLGGIAGALARRAEALYAQSTRAQQEAARRIFGRLVSLGEGTEDTRRRVRLTELGGDPDTAAALEIYGGARLLAFDCDPITHEPVVEIAHEALLWAWPRARTWIDLDRERLRVQRHLTFAAAEWSRRDRHEDELYVGDRLRAAETLLEENPTSLNELETSFVRAGRDRAVSQRRARRRRVRTLQGLLATAAVLLVIAVIAGVVARDRALEAGEQRDAARAAIDQLQAEVVRRDIVDLAATGLPVLPTLLAIELYTLDPGSASLDTLARAMLAQPDWLGALPGWWVATSAAGPWVVTVEHDTVVLRSPDDLSAQREHPVGPTRPNEGPALSPAISPDGARLVIDQPGGPAIVDLESGRVGDPIAVQPARDGSYATTSVAWTHDGTHLIVAAAPDRLVTVAVDGLSGTVDSTTALGRTLVNPHLATHPTDSTLALSNAGTVVLIDAAEIATGRLAIADAVELSSGTITGSRSWWSADGLLYAATFGEEVVVIDDGRVRTLDRLPPSTNRVVATPLGGDELFVADGNGGDASIIEIETGRLVDGPWPTSTGVGSYGPAVDVMGGDVIATVDEASSSIQLWSRVGGNTLSDTLAPFEVSNRGVFHLPESNVAQPIGSTTVWYLGGDQAVGVDFGVADIAAVQMSPTDDGDVAVVTDATGRATVHELPSGERVGPTVSTGSRDSLGMLTEDRERLAVQAPTGIRVFDFTTGAELAAFSHGRDRGTYFMVSDDLAATVGTRAAGDDPVTLVVDVDRLEEVFRGPAYATRFTPDGSGFFTASPATDGWAIVDMATEATIWQGPPFDQAFFGGFDPTGQYVIHWFDAVQFFDFATLQPVGPRIEGTASQHWDTVALTQVRDGRAHVWRSDPTTWPAIACEVAGRNLTRDEWEAHMPDGIPYAPSCDEWPIEA